MSLSAAATWDARYDGNVDEPIGWYCDYAALVPLIKPLQRPRTATLVVGCGTSAFPDDLYDRGFKQVTAVDFSRVAVEAVQARSAAAAVSRSGLTTHLLDVRVPGCLEQLGKGPFDLVIDKGTLDCILCGAEGFKDARAALRNVYAAMRTPATLLCVSHSPPEDRLHLFECCLWHDIKVKTVRSGDAWKLGWQPLDEELTDYPFEFKSDSVLSSSRPPAQPAAQDSPGAGVAPPGEAGAAHEGDGTPPGPAQGSEAVVAGGGGAVSAAAASAGAAAAFDVGLSYVYILRK